MTMQDTLKTSREQDKRIRANTNALQTTAKSPFLSCQQKLRMGRIGLKKNRQWTIE